MAYENALQQWYGQCPSPVQTVLNFGGAYDKVNNSLIWAAGDPEGLVTYATKYVGIGNQIQHMASEITATSQSLPSWTGAARDQYGSTVSDYAAKVESLAESVTATNEILISCAEGSVEVANAIVDLVKMFIEFFIQSLAISLALSVLSFGASVAAWVAANLAKAADMAAKVLQVLQKFATFLGKVAQLLRKVADILTKIATLITKIKAIFDFLGTIKFSDGLVAKGLAMGGKAIIGMGTRPVVNPLIPGADMPKWTEEGMNTWDHVQSARDSAAEAQETVDANRPPEF